MIYLDNSATTQPHPEVLETYMKVSSQYFGNPSSLHTLGMESEALLTKARQMMAEYLEVKPKEVIFTSGGTEGNNLAIKGTAVARRNRGKHLITTEVEHASAYETFKELESLGYQVTYLPVDQNGEISVSDLENAIVPDTILVSIIHVNNETGVIQPIEEVGEVLRRYPHVRFHVDHVQGATKVPLPIKKANIDLCTLSAHKFHGMKGTGLLYVKEGVRLFPLLHGGVQEQKLRAGTENVAGAVAMAKAYRIEMEQSKQGKACLTRLHSQLVHGLEKMEDVEINSPKTDAAYHIVNFSIPNTKPEVIIQSFAAKNIYVSTKSACSSKLAEPSRVLLAMGLNEERASSAIRISLSFQNTEEEIDIFLKELKQLILGVTRIKG
ncbi:cysteine desulfurase family protein [Halalkalibacter urbisdiaboli]|uniref:cysteine desulfurase family protein n=1 Tax=Halalkalibacter urbisdiaboli TaxID=1960589 RepID=UPI000B4327E4|nr:cysteine desulfurase family protein [Halalkalibacter urbisdiaboli]